MSGDELLIGAAIVGGLGLAAFVVYEVTRSQQATSASVAASVAANAPHVPQTITVNPLANQPQSFSLKVGDTIAFVYDPATTGVNISNQLGWTQPTITINAQSKMATASYTSQVAVVTTFTWTNSDNWNYGAVTVTVS